MRIIVFGGSGGMGSRAVTELAVTPGVARVTIAGRNRDKAEAARERARRAQADATRRVRADATRRIQTGKTAGGHGEPTAEVHVELQDAADHGAVVALMRDYDVAVGALGPFYVFEAPMVRAAIEAQTAYVSLCDDADAAAAALAYDDAARDAGVPIITGLGWTPGMTNLLVMRAAAKLDTVKTVRIAWAGSGREADGPAVLLHTMHIMSGHVPSFAGGRRVEVRAGSGSELITFPAPLGPVRVCHVGHPEPITLPDYLPGLERLELKGGIVEPTLHGLGALTGRLGLGATHGRRRVLASMMQPMIPLLSRLGPRRPQLSGVSVRVEGEKAGRARIIEAAGTGSMEALTSIPVAVGALWLAEGRIDAAGVYPPEAPGGPAPEPFLDALARRGIELAYSDEPA